MQIHQLIAQTVEEIQHLYLRDDIPWIVGCSWGKDSSCALQLIWQAKRQARTAPASQERQRYYHRYWRGKPFDCQLLP